MGQKLPMQEALDLHPDARRVLIELPEAPDAPPSSEEARRELRTALARYLKALRRLGHERRRPG